MTEYKSVEWLQGFARPFAIMFMVLFAGMVTALAGSGEALAQQCNKFDPAPTPLSNQWVPCADAPNIGLTTSNVDSIGGTGDNYLLASDQSGGSQLCTSNTNPLLGDWSKMAQCGELCFDAQAFDLYDSTPRAIWARIEGAGGKKFSFIFSNPADKITADKQWHKFCFPLGTIGDGAPLPSNGHGTWIPVPASGTVSADWNAMLANVTELRLPVDFTSSPTEKIGYDNICLVNGTCSNAASVIKVFTKTVSRNCNVLTYKIHLEIERDGGSPDAITVSDVWPSGLVPAPSIQYSSNTGIPGNPVINSAGWSYVFNTKAGPAGQLVNSVHDITFTSTIDPAALNGTELVVSNQVVLKAASQPGMTFVSDDTSTALAGDATKISVPVADVKACLGIDVIETTNPDCLSGEVKVTCGTVPGTYVIMLNASGAGGVTPDSVSIVSNTAGVTILNPQAAYPVINGKVKFTVAGANPGDSLSFDLEGTKLGAGAVEGSDLCCNGTIKVEIPKDLPCEKSTVDVTKVCEPARYLKYALGPAIDAIGWVASCKITIKTTGPQTGTLSVADQLTGGGTLLGVNSTSTPPWTCGPSGCSINGNLLDQTASTSVFAAEVAFSTKGGALEARNCASVYGRQKPLDRDCTRITVDDPQEPEVTITKLCEPARQLDSPVLQFGAKCTITVTTTGPIQTHLVVSDSLTGNGQVTSFTNSSTPAWTCIAGQCDMEGSNLNQTSSVSTFDAFVTFPTGQGAEQASAKNCAKLGFDAHPVSESCADIKAEDDKFKLDVKKVCSAVIALTANGPWAGACKITVTATGGPRPPFISITDVISDVNATRTPPVSMTNMVSADPWTCAAPSGAGGPLNCSIAGSAFPATGTSTLDIDVHVPIGVRSGEARNCVKAAGVSDAQTLAPSNPPVSTEQVCVPLPGGTGTPPPDGDGTLTVTKVCDPAVPTGTNNDWGGQSLPTVQSICHLTVAGSGNLPPVIELHENLLSGAPAANSPMQINISGMSSPQNWQFPAFPVPQGTADGSPSTPALATISSADLLAAGGTSTIDVTVQFMNAGWATETQNCVQALGVSTPGAAPGAQSEQVCVPFVEGGQMGRLVVRKEALHNGQHVTNQTFPVSVTCGGITSTGTVADGVPYYTPGAIPVGSTCTVVETPGTPASDLCPAGTAGSWEVSYSSPGGVPVVAGLTSITITNQLSCKPIVVKNPPACDPATATKAGDLCRCRFDNMLPVSKTACECRDGFTLKAGQGCVRKVVEPKCDPATTVTKGGKCVCEYRNMVQTSPSACACAEGFKFATGKGCFKPEPECKRGERYQAERGRCEPVCGKGFDYSVKRNACIQRQPECKPGTKFNPKNGRCDVIRPVCSKGTVYNAKRDRCDAAQPICRKPFVWDPKRNACVEQVRRCEPGTIPFRGRCVPVPKCPRGQVPIPGTPLCVAIGGGGGGPKDPDGKVCRDGNVIVPCR